MHRLGGEGGKGNCDMTGGIGGGGDGVHTQGERIIIAHTHGKRLYICTMEVLSLVPKKKFERLL